MQIQIQDIRTGESRLWGLVASEPDRLARSRAPFIESAFLAARSCSFAIDAAQSTDALPMCLDFHGVLCYNQKGFYSTKQYESHEQIRSGTRLPTSVRER
jgi:hypothetical protein